MLFAAAGARASQLEVGILDKNGLPAGGMVVIAEPLNLARRSGQALASKIAEQETVPTAVVDQIKQQFVPQILSVQAGTAIVFPNSDAVAHQVYSFSAPKRFELGLYRGRQHPPVVFDKPGLVVLGCNIHDNMIGYVYVSETPYHGTSDEQGRWRAASIEPGEYRVRLLSPRLAKRESTLERTIEIIAGQDQSLSFQLKEPLRPLGAPQTEHRVRDY